MRSHIEFQMADSAYIGQTDYTASCVITADPIITKLYMFISSGQRCDYKLEDTIQIGRYTTKASIRVNHMTSGCSKITCATTIFQENRTIGE